MQYRRAQFLIVPGKTLFVCNVNRDTNPAQLNRSTLSLSRKVKKKKSYRIGLRGNCKIQLKYHRGSGGRRSNVRLTRFNYSRSAIDRSVAIRERVRNTSFFLPSFLRYRVSSLMNHRGSAIGVSIHVPPVRDRLMGAFNERIYSR